MLHDRAFIQISGSITVWLVYSLTGLDSVKQENVFYFYVVKLLNPNLTVVQLYSDTPPYGVMANVYLL